MTKYWTTKAIRIETTAKSRSMRAAHCSSVRLALGRSVSGPRGPAPLAMPPAALSLRCRDSTAAEL